MDRLVDTIDRARSVRDAAQTSAGQETQRTGDNARLVGDNVTEQVTCDDDTIQLARVLDHDHSSRINKLVLDLELGEFLGHDLGDGLAPQTAGREDIGLVERPDGERRVVLEGEVGAEAGDALDLGARVGLRVQGVAAAVVFLALAKVDAAG